MAKAIVTFTDSGKGVKANLTFDPPVKPKGKCPPAQMLALELLELLGERVSGKRKPMDDDDLDDEDGFFDEDEDEE